MAVFPFQNVLSKLPPPSSKMATDVNCCIQTPTRLACQLLSKQIYNRTAHSWRARGLILLEKAQELVTCTVESGACPLMGGPSLEGRSPRQRIFLEATA